MPDIEFQFPIQAEAGRVFDALTTEEGLDQWWTESSTCEPRPGGTYTLFFPPDYSWQAQVRTWEPPYLFELEMTLADSDWTGTRLSFHLEEKEGAVMLHFLHSGWPEPNEHFRSSAFCWAMYLRILRRFLEAGERVPYEKRLEA